MDKSRLHFAYVFGKERFEAFSYYSCKDFLALNAYANGSELVWGGGIGLLRNENDMGVVDE